MRFKFYLLVVAALALSCTMAQGKRVKYDQRALTTQQILDGLEPKALPETVGKIAQAETKGPPMPGDMGTLNLFGEITNYWDTQLKEQTPLIIYAHSFQGCSTEMTYLTSELARSGYLVVAANLYDAKCKGRRNGEKSLSDPATWDDTSFILRRDELRRVYRGLRADPQWRNRIDWSRVGFMGYGLGGYSVLAMAGGQATWKAEGISGVMAISPTCAALTTMEVISVPIMFIGGSKDEVSRKMVSGENGCFAKTNGEVSLVELNGATHGAYSDTGAVGHSAVIAYAKQFFGALFAGQAQALKKVPGTATIQQK